MFGCKGFSDQTRSAECRKRQKNVKKNLNKKNIESELAEQSNT